MSEATSTVIPDTIVAALTDLLKELVDGLPEDGMAFILNPGDPGLLVSMGNLSAAEASMSNAGGASTVAAHVDHLRYGLTLLNRWSAGENPFADADYSASWRRREVSDAGWEELRRDLRQQAMSWRGALTQHRELSPIELRGVIASIAHLAYHLGAIRQIARGARGPLARD